MPRSASQQDLSRGKVSIRGSQGSAVRSRGWLPASENISYSGAISKYASHPGRPSSGKVQPSLPLNLPKSRPSSATFGTDITNISGRPEKLQPLKPLPPVQPPSHMGPTTAFVAEAKEEPKADRSKAQSVEEYKADIGKRLFDDEKSFMPEADYMDGQTDLTPKMRMILMDWLIEVHMKYRLCRETLHLTVNLIDRYLSTMPVARKNLQLVGITSMFIASKFEEIDPPELHDWVYITDKAYTKDDVLAMEVTMLNVLGFRIVVPTVALFFPIFEKPNGCNEVHKELAEYILELSILDMQMLKYPPSHMVAAALLLSNELLGRCRPWPHDMAKTTKLKESELRPCADLMRQLFDNDRAAEGPQLQAVHKKFSLKDHHSVATMRL